MIMAARCFFTYGSNHRGERKVEGGRRREGWVVRFIYKERGFGEGGPTSIEAISSYLPHIFFVTYYAWTKTEP